MTRKKENPIPLIICDVCWDDRHRDVGLHRCKRPARVCHCPCVDYMVWTTT